MSTFNILITSISDKIPMLDAVKESLNKIASTGQVFIGDSNKNCVARYYHHFFWEMPETEELTIDKIKSFCRRNNIKLIIPSRDGELLFWASIKMDLEILGINVLISPSNTIEKCYDKLHFSNIDYNGLCKTIPTYEDINDAFFDRFVVKERFGSGSSRIGINLTKIKALDYAKTLKNPIFQPYIKGEEISVDIYCDNKYKYIGSISRKRVLVKNGESKVTTSFSDKTIDSICLNLTSQLDFTGPIVLQFIKSKDALYALECNPRFGGCSTLGIKSGLKIFEYAISQFKNPFLNLSFEKDFKRLTQVRVSKDIYL